MGEAVELAEEVLQLPADGPCDPDLQLRLGREIYDVLWNACDLARLTGIAVAAAAAEKRQVNENRTWSEPQGHPAPRRGLPVVPRHISHRLP
jgi:NTP pyrophosphatase (non-canonical NTP hydrolase)